MPGELRTEWDPRKSEANRRKHGIDFEFASRVFYDPLRQLDLEGDEHGEIRWRTIGEIDGVLYVVSHTIREEGEEETHRIVTARRATPRDREAFEEAS
jgi:uncharacterized protein